MNLSSSWQDNKYICLVGLIGLSRLFGLFRLLRFIGYIGKFKCQSEVQMSKSKFQTRKLIKQIERIKRIQLVLLEVFCDVVLDGDTAEAAIIRVALKRDVGIPVVESVLHG